MVQQPMRLVDERATRQATVTDFVAAFDVEMHMLYLLAFLLTADHDKAEQCLVCAMGECAEWIGVFADRVKFMEPASGSEACDSNDHARTRARG